MTDQNDIEIKPEILQILSKKEIYYYKMVDRYFKHCGNGEVKKMLDIINGDSEISLRILDWFVTSYAGKYKVTFNTGKEDDDDVFNVHISYKAQLKSYKKKYFDPFRRRKKFNYHYDTNNKDNFLYTTIGQLNFFRWAMNNKIIGYVEKNYNSIIKAMNMANKEEKSKKKKRSESDPVSSGDSDDSNCSTASSKGSKTSNVKSKGKVSIKSKNKSKNNLKLSARKEISDNEVKIILDFD